LGHIPSVSAPVFRCPEGLPFGVQFISKRWNDYTLLQAIEDIINKDIIPNNSLPIIE
jgi:Asp-tRNA(Asn)/Glu-tRNA(Gln) amidotransferase A subunit family amidase